MFYSAIRVQKTAISGGWCPNSLMQPGARRRRWRGPTGCARQRPTSRSQVSRPHGPQRGMNPPRLLLLLVTLVVTSACTVDADGDGVVSSMDAGFDTSDSAGEADVLGDTASSDTADDGATPDVDDIGVEDAEDAEDGEDGGADDASDAGAEDAISDATPADAGAELDWPALEWSHATRVAMSAPGASQPAIFTIPRGVRTVFARATPVGFEGGDDACFVFDEVSLDDAELVPDWATMPPELACSGCAQRVSIGAGVATMAIPNDGEAIDAGDLTARVQVVDCATALELTPPDTLEGFTIDWAADTDARATGRVSIVVGFAPGTPYAGDAAAFDAVFEAANALFASAGITLELVAARDLTTPMPDELHFGPGLMSPMDAAFEVGLAELLADVPQRPVLPVFVVPCLVRVSGGGSTQTVFAGYAPRIPGGLSTANSADGVWLAVGECPDAGFNPGASLAEREPQLLGRLLAHELGHALGLYHSDQEFGAHVVDDFDTNLMRSSVVFDPAEPALAFSAAQGRVMRTHPYVLADD